MTHDTKLNLHQRLHAVMGEVDYIQKERKQGMRYTIVSHDAVTAKVRPILHKHGVVYYPARIDCGQTGNRTEMNMAVRFVNVDDPADAIEVATAGYGIDDQDKGPGKAISYGVKYALLKVLGLETGDDPDLDQDAKHEPKKEPPATPAQPRNGLAEGAAEAWKDWALGDQARGWFKSAKIDLGNMQTAAEIGLWQRKNSKELGALDQFATDRHTMAMDAINERLAAVRARAPANLRAAG